METTEQVRASLKIVQAVAEAIRDVKKVPSGHLYAKLMGVMTLEEYNWIIEKLKGAGLVVEHCHELKWVEPKMNDDEDLKNQLKHSRFGCCNCLWAGCECQDQSKFKIKYYKGEISCEGYNYYD